MNCNALRSVLVGGLAASAAIASAQVSLTGINWFTTDSTKHYNGGYANTFGGDTYSRNLYVSVNQSVGGGPLSNSLNLTTVPTRVNIDLSTPGNYTFQMYCNDESTTNNPFWGLNLFFNGNDLQPGISVWDVVNVGGFQTINPTGTPTLDPLTMGLVQGGSTAPEPSISFAGTKVKLTAYNTWSVSHYNVDRVDNFSDMGGAGNGTKDDVIEFTLQVTQVPEPMSSVALAAGACALISRRRRSRSRS